ncbi:MAG: hypothetical protein ACSI46_20265 [Gloeotrichia echinulata DVL01]
MHLPINCSGVDYHAPDKFVTKQVAIFHKKNPPIGLSLPGELIIRVHLPINCSGVDYHAPDKFVTMNLTISSIKKFPSRSKPTRGVSYQGASTN